MSSNGDADTFSFANPSPTPSINLCCSLSQYAKNSFAKNSRLLTLPWMSLIKAGIAEKRNK
jgi:hypothetical protein